jgi:hypothetical protein
MRNQGFYFKKGAMFGLDARIALAILAIVALSIGFVEEKQVTKSQNQETIQKLEYLKKIVLNNWEKTFKFDMADSNSAYQSLLGHQALTTAVFNYNLGLNNQFTFERIQLPVTTTHTAYLTDYSHPDSSVTYSVLDATYKASTISTVAENNQAILFNMKNSFRSVPEFSNFMLRLRESLYTKLTTMFTLIAEDHGYKMLTTHGDAADTFFFGTAQHVAFSQDAYGNDIKFYTIVEMNINDKNPLEYITYFVLYSEGKDKTLNSTRPTNIAELRTFAAQGDDVFKIFSDKAIYMSNKLESQKRLTEVKIQLAKYAESAYMTRLSLCASQATLTADCDFNSDTVYDNKDEALLLDRNPFPKAAEDSTATYLNSTNAFTLGSTPQVNFLYSLGLPGYYSSDRYGSLLKYDSNLGNNDKGPFTVEVWY